jgi:hypothetical protein
VGEAVLELASNGPDGASAVYQSVQLGQKCLLVGSSLNGLSDISAEVQPLCRMRDLLVEPFARGCDATEFGDQLRLAHLVQANHRAMKPARTAGPAAFAGGRASFHPKDADQLEPDDQ